jgi:murein DD-endopeptidase MepM/ murein hydrolase activator NlpD
VHGVRVEAGTVDPFRPRALRALAIAAGAAALVALVVPTTQAQVPPVVDGSSTTTAPSETTTTAAPSGSQPSSEPSGDQFAGSNQAPAGAQDAGGDGAAPPAGGIVVPPEAQRIINSVKRSRPNNSEALVAMVTELQQLGLSEQEAYRVGMGRFPIAGRATYSHDWLYPRYGPGFRFHLGTDVFAAYGTPVRAPVDGVAISANGGLGGLTVKVVMPDGTYFYLAHLAGLAEGFTDGMAVSTGDVVGYVGDSGNARGGAPHLHIGIYPHGRAPVDPKPILDHFLAEAAARMPEVVAALQAANPAGVPAAPVATAPAVDPRALRPMLATGVLHPLAAGGARLPAEVLYFVGSNPLDGSHALVDLALADLVERIDWTARSLSG